MQNTGNSFSFITDVHGNLDNIDLFLKQSKQRGVEHVIFGGDVMPKKKTNVTSDGQAVTTRITGSFPPEVEIGILADKKREAYRQGYMLFPTRLSLSDLHNLVTLYEILRSSVSPSGSANLRPRLELQHIDTFEQHSRELLLKTLKTAAGNHIHKKIESITAAMSIHKTYTCEQLTQDFVNHLKYEYLCMNGLIRDIEKRNQLFFGQAEVADSSWKDISERIWEQRSLGIFDHLAKLLLGAMPPFTQWENEWRNLDQYALKKQRIFLRDLFKKIQQFRSGFRGTVSLILGNDDHHGLVGDLEVADREKLLIHASNRVVPLGDTIDMLGFSYVPPAYASYDAWYRSEETIERELEKLHEQVRFGIQFIANIHCPPSETALCRAIVPGMEQTDFGSTGVRHFIENHQPAIGLFGHIHESYKVTGRVQDHIKSSVLYNPGASEYKPRFIYGSVSTPESYSVYPE